MKVKVISVFRDKNIKNKKYKLNEELEVSKERYEEIKEYVNIINSTSKEGKTEKAEVK